MSALSAGDHADQDVADRREPGPGDVTDTDCEARALAAYRRESVDADVRAVVVRHYGPVALIVASACTPVQLGGGTYCQCEALAAYRIRGDGRLRRTGTRLFIHHARDQHKSPEELAAEAARTQVLLRMLQGGA